MVTRRFLPPCCLSESTGYCSASGPTSAASVFNYGLPCTGSPTPATVDIPTLISTGTLSSTVRVTEASIAAFQPVTASADFGVRIKLNLSGYPSGATVYVPDVIVGNRASTPQLRGHSEPPPRAALTRRREIRFSWYASPAPMQPEREGPSFFRRLLAEQQPIQPRFRFLLSTARQA